jgi:uncharacterized protein (DUF1684 family)
MMKFGYFGVGFYLVAATLVFTSNAVANNIESEAQETWLASVHESWAEQDREFKNSPTSPLAGASRFEIIETEPVYFAEKDGKLGWSLEPGDQSKFSLVLAEGRWKWKDLSAEVTCTREGENTSSGSFLLAGDVLKTGRFSVEAYPNENQITALVFDANSQKVKDFNTLQRFEANARFAVTANIVKFESPEQVELITGLQRIKERFKYAIVEFEIDGVELELTAYKYALKGEHSEVLFIPFTDKTTGKYSYGGGRYLSVEEPGEGAEVLIDFNLVTNPLCAYTPIYNCIVPGRENRLPIEILAGEKKYH